MKIWSKVTYRWDDARQEFALIEAESESHEYEGPVAQCGKSRAPAADPAIGQAGLENIKLGKEWLNFSKEQFAIGSKRQEGVDALAMQVSNQQLADSKKAGARGDEQWARYQKLFQPAEDRLAADAMSYDSPAKQAQAAAAAKADVLTNVAQQKEQRTREMAAMGIDPTSGRFAGVERAGDTRDALAAAGAQNQARLQTQMTGMALREGAVNLGRGATSNSAQQAMMGLNAGNSAVGTTLSAEGNFRANQGTMNTGFQGGISGNSSGAGILNADYQNKLAKTQADNARVSSTFETLAGAAGMIYSSKDYKENKEPFDGALQMIDGMPIEKWKYKDGIGDGKEHVGPYAEDFKKKTGRGDGKTISIIDGIGVTMKAMQELNRKVDKIAARQGA